MAISKEDNWTRDLQRSTDKELRVYLIGKSGAGKSETGNTLVGSTTFKSKMSPKPVTTAVDSGYRDFKDRRFVFVDSPGLFFDKTFSEEKMNAELAKAALILAPGPHVFILVIGLNRFDDSEAKAIDMYKEAFGNGIMGHMIVVFTGKDQLDQNGDSIENFVQKYPLDQKLFLGNCGNRYFAMNNLALGTEREKQATILMEKMLELDKVNQGKYYDNEVLKRAQEAVEEMLDDMHNKHPEDKASVLRASLRWKTARELSSTEIIVKILVAHLTILGGIVVATKVVSSLK